MSDPHEQGRAAADSGQPASDRSTTAARTTGAVADHRSASPVPTRLEQARAEIDRLRTVTLLPWLWLAAKGWAEGVLAAADATLDRHAPWGPEAWQGYYCAGDHPRDHDGRPDADWPCPDAAAVLDLYAPEPAS